MMFDSSFPDQRPCIPTRASWGLLLLMAVGISATSCVPCPDDGDDEPEPTTYSGRATVARLTIQGASSSFIDTGELSKEGGALEASLLEVGITDVMTADVAHAVTVGGNGIARSEASLANLRVLIDENLITADFLMSRAVARCTGNQPPVEGTFEIANFVVNDETITVVPGENQELQLLDPDGNIVGRIILNEVVSNSDGNFSERTVNALRIEVFDVAELVLFHAHADVTCAVSEPADDLLTGGGRIDGMPSGEPAAFGVAGGIVNGEFWGHLNYVDRAADLHVRGTAVTAYTEIDATTRRIEGTAEINGAGGFTYLVEASDNGEPGTADTFRIVLSNGYEASGTLIGGNIQIHDLD